MRKNPQKIVKIGNSCYVCLPKEVLFASQLQLNDEIKIKWAKNKITISKV